MHIPVIATLGVFAVVALGLDEPLDIKIDKSVECSRKSQRGQSNRRSRQLQC